MLAVAVPAGFLAAQDYVLTVGRTDVTGGVDDVAEYFFRVASP